MSSEYDYSIEHLGEERTLEDVWILQTQSNVTICPNIARINPRRKVEIARSHVSKFYPHQVFSDSALIEIFNGHAYREGTVRVSHFRVTDNATGALVRQAYDVRTDGSMRDIADENWNSTHVA